MTNGRTFTHRQKACLSVVQDVGIEGMEADHVVPYSAGGPTDVANGQLILTETNRMKSDFVFTPRKWQRLFLAQWGGRKSNAPFLLVAVPGGGKTFAALEAARTWLSVSPDRRLMIVVPTDGLRTQWQDDAALFGISLQSKEFAGRFKQDFHGGVTTYQSVGSNSGIFRALSSRSETMVIFDEIHHCGEDATFGNSITYAFENAKEVLALSGTPWRSEGNKIPFVKYKNGFADADFAYDYESALSDGVVRYLTFAHADGAIKYDADGRIEPVNAGITEKEAQDRLRKLLDPSGEFIERQIIDAHKKLMQIRSEVRDAAGLAACIDQDHAEKVAKKIKQLTGCDPSVIVSDESRTNDEIRRFRTCSKEWLVTVRKVSEGTDIKRLQVLCYFTNITSDLFFRQLVGRVSRVRESEDFEAYVYLPADPRLIACAQNINDAQIKALANPIEESQSKDKEATQFELPAFDSYTTFHEGVGLVLIAGEKVSPDEAAIIEAQANAVGISMEKVLKLRRMMQQEGVMPARQQSHRQQIGLEQQITELRRKCNTLIVRYCRTIGQANSEGYKNAHKLFPPQGAMSKTELEKKAIELQKMIARAGR